MEEIFVYGPKHRDTVKRYLVMERGWKCEICNLTKWNNEDIPLELHHIDGDGLNNIKENLQLLCPNCHAQTDNFCGKNKTKKVISDEDLISALRNNLNIHQALLSLGRVDGRLYERAYYLIDKENIVFPEKEREEKKCKKCGKIISKRAMLCEECYHLLSRKNDRPSKEQLKKEIREETFVNLGKKYGVSDNTIRKWCVSFGLPSRKKDINNLSQEEWEKL